MVLGCWASGALLLWRLRRAPRAEAWLSTPVTTRAVLCRALPWGALAVAAPLVATELGGRADAAFVRSGIGVPAWTHAAILGSRALSQQPLLLAPWLVLVLVGALPAGASPPSRRLVLGYGLGSLGLVALLFAYQGALQLPSVFACLCGQHGEIPPYGTYLGYPFLLPPDHWSVRPFFWSSTLTGLTLVFLAANLLGAALVVRLVPDLSAPRAESALAWASLCAPPAAAAGLWGGSALQEVYPSLAQSSLLPFELSLAATAGVLATLGVLAWRLRGLSSGESTAE